MFGDKQTQGRAQDPAGAGITWRAHQGIELRGFWNNPALIDCYLGEDQVHTYLVLAERHDNEGTSITNAFEDYVLQLQDRFAFDPARTVFYDLYVVPYVKGGCIAYEYRFTLCQPSLPGRAAAPTTWRPANTDMDKALLHSLREQCVLTDSYTLSRRELTGLRSA